MLISKPERLALAARLKSDIDAYCQSAYADKKRGHLGASMIGDICMRRLWYNFRWVHTPVFSGRMMRLFNRGHKEEARFVEWLQGIGCQVWEVDPETQKQFRIYGVYGHFAGSLDGVNMLPQNYTQWPPGPYLTEFKTHNDKSFAKIVKEGVKASKAKHWAQMCEYGWKYGFRYALYFAINKNDDDLYIECVELDWNLAAELERKAEHIISRQEPPARYSEQATNFECKLCDYFGVCHRGADYERNCRSCQFAVPGQDESWFCTGHQATIPKDFIPLGCGHWHPIGRQ